MKKGLLILTALLIGISVFGQDKTDKMRDRIMAQKIAFITSELDLSAEEAQNFWPIYNEYQGEIEANKSEDSFKKAKKSMSDGEAQEMLDNDILKSQKDLDIKKMYIQKFSSVIPVRKIALLFYAEKQFKRNMLDAVGKRMNKRKQKRD